MGAIVGLIFKIAAFFFGDAWLKHSVRHAEQKAAENKGRVDGIGEGYKRLEESLKANAPKDPTVEDLNEAGRSY